MNQLETLGDCRSESLIEDIFGSVSEFACAVEEKGNSFTDGWLVVKYNHKTDIHTFYRKHL